MYLIGLTGNIASGKSTVCQILQPLGVCVIDADVLAHAALMRGTSAWFAVAETFGVEILRDDGEVDRQKLGAVVFADPAKLQQLEAIVHPVVRTQLALLLREAREEVIVIEAIKLIEAGLHQYCDAVWIVTAPASATKRRLMQERGLSEEAAELRLRAQPPVEEKLKLATVVIDNRGGQEALRVQVLRGFAAVQSETASDKTPMLAEMLGLKFPAPVAPVPATPPQAGSPVAIPAEENAPLPEPSPTPAPPAELLTEAEATLSPELQITVRRARPGDVALLSQLLARLEGVEPLSRAETLKRFGKWGYWLAELDGMAVGLAAWRAENLVALLRDLWAYSSELAPRVFPALFAAIEQEAEGLQCEAALVLTGARNDALAQPVLMANGYAVSSLDELHKLWRAVAQDELRRGEKIYLKRLRAEMVTKPI